MAIQGRAGTWPSDGVLPQHAEGPELPLTASPENYKFSKLDTVIYNSTIILVLQSLRHRKMAYSMLVPGGGGGN